MSENLRIATKPKYKLYFFFFTFYIAFYKKSAVKVKWTSESYYFQAAYVIEDLYLLSNKFVPFLSIIYACISPRSMSFCHIILLLFSRGQMRFFCFSQIINELYKRPKHILIRIRIHNKFSFRSLTRCIIALVAQNFLQCNLGEQVSSMYVFQRIRTPRT